MNILQDKLNFLLNKYEVKKKVILDSDNKYVVIDKNKYILLPWRNERRFIELKKIVEQTVGNISHFKIMSLNPKNIQLEEIIKREIDTAMYISGLNITEIYQTKNGKTCSILCMTDKKAIITLELDATLEINSDVIDKHEIITDRGTCCDRNVDSQTPLSSIYVYGNKNEEFTDVDFELYGLSIYQISVVRQAFDIAKNEKLGIDNNIINEKLNVILEKAEYSEKNNVNVNI